MGSNVFWLVMNSTKIYRMMVFLQEETSGIGGALLKPQPTSPPPDMSPFFLRQYVKVSVLPQKSQIWENTITHDRSYSELKNMRHLNSMFPTVTQLEV